MQQIAQFFKVSEEQFVRDWCAATRRSADEAKKVYQNIRLPRRATKGSAGYDFFAPESFTLVPHETILIPTGIRVMIEDGWVLSYYDSPLNSEATSNRLYIDLLSQATDYAWFFTPYLMLGDDLLDAMLAAAQRGVDVRIIMPGIPDKKLIFRMSRSFYQVLLTGGVKIYEYTPGFVHAKSLVCDDRAATVGTVNLDYRSLFLHFENNSLFYRGSIVARVKEDFLATQSQCRAVEACDTKRYSRRWIVDGVLRIFAPLC